MAEIDPDFLQLLPPASVQSKAADCEVPVFKVSSLALAASFGPARTAESVAKDVCTKFNAQHAEKGVVNSSTASKASVTGGGSSVDSSTHSLLTSSVRLEQRSNQPPAPVVSQVLSVSYTLGRPAKYVPGVGARLRVLLVSCWEEFFNERALLVSRVLPAVRAILEPRHVHVTWTDRPWVARDLIEDGLEEGGREGEEEEEEGDGESVREEIRPELSTESIGEGVSEEVGDAYKVVERFRDMEESYVGAGRAEGSTCLLGLVGVRGSEMVEGSGEVVRRCLEAGYIAVGRWGVLARGALSSLSKVELDLAVGRNLWEEGVCRLRDEVRGGMRGWVSKLEAAKHGIEAVDLLGADGDALSRDQIAQARVLLSQLLRGRGTQSKKAAEFRSIGGKGGRGGLVVDGGRIERVKQSGRQGVVGGMLSMREGRGQHIKQVGELVTRTVNDEVMRGQFKSELDAVTDVLMSRTATAVEVQAKVQGLMLQLTKVEEGVRDSAAGVGGKLLRRLLQVDDLLLADDLPRDDTAWTNSGGLGTLTTPESAGDAFRRQNAQSLAGLLPKVPIGVVWTLMEELVAALEGGDDHMGLGGLLEHVSSTEKRLEGRARRRVCRLWLARREQNEQYDVEQLIDTLVREVARCRPCGDFRSRSHAKDDRRLRETLRNALDAMGMLKLFQNSIGPRASFLEESSAEMSAEFEPANSAREGAQYGNDREEVLVVAAQMLRLVELRDLREAMEVGWLRAKDRKVGFRPSMARIYVRGTEILNDQQLVQEVPRPVRAVVGLIDRNASRDEATEAEEEGEEEEEGPEHRGRASEAHELGGMLAAASCSGAGGCRVCVAARRKASRDSAVAFRRELLDSGSVWRGHVTLYEQGYGGFDRADGWIRVKLSKVIVDSMTAGWSVSGSLWVRVRVGACVRAWRVGAGMVKDMEVPQSDENEFDFVLSAEEEEGPEDPKEWVSVQIVGGRVTGVTGVGQGEGVIECDVGLGDVVVELAQRNLSKREEKLLMRKEIKLLDLLPLAAQSVRNGAIPGQRAGQRRRVWVHDGIDAMSLIPSGVEQPDQGQFAHLAVHELHERLWDWIARMTVDSTKNADPGTGWSSMKEDEEAEMQLNLEDFLNILVHSLMLPEHVTRAEATKIFRIVNRSQLLLDSEPVMGKEGLYRCIVHTMELIGPTAVAQVLQQYHEARFQECYAEAEKHARVPTVGVEVVLQYETASVLSQARGVRFEEGKMEAFGRSVIQHLLRCAALCTSTPLMQVNSKFVQRREEQGGWRAALTDGGGFRVEEGNQREGLLEGLVGLARRFVCGEPDEGDLPVVMVQGEGGSGRSALMAQVIRELESDKVWVTEEKRLKTAKGELLAEGIRTETSETEPLERLALCVGYLRGWEDTYEDVLEYLALELLLKGVGGGAVTAANAAAHSPLSTPFSRLLDAIQQARAASGRRIVLVVDGLLFNEAVHFATNFLSRALWTTPAPLRYKACCILSTNPPGIETTLASPWSDQMFLSSLPFRVPTVDDRAEENEGELDEDLETCDEMRQRVVLEAGAWLAHKSGVLVETMPVLSYDERFMVLQAAFLRRGIADRALIDDIGDVLCSNASSTLPLYLEHCAQILSHMSPAQARFFASSLPTELSGTEGFIIPVIEGLEAQYGVEVVGGVCLGAARYGGSTEEEIAEELNSAMMLHGHGSVELQVVQAVLETLRQFMPWLCGPDAPARDSQRCCVRELFKQDLLAMFVCNDAPALPSLRASLHLPLDRANRRLAAAWRDLPTLSNPSIPPLQLQSSAHRRSAPSTYPLPFGRTPSQRNNAVSVRNAVSLGGAEGMGDSQSGERDSKGQSTGQKQRPASAGSFKRAASGRGFWFGSRRLSTWNQDADWKSFVRTETMLARQYGDPSRAEKFWSGGSLKRSFTFNPLV